MKISMFKCFIKYALAAAGILVISCATTWEGKKYGRSGGRQKTPADITRTHTAKEIKKPLTEPQLALASSPARSASMEKVVRGKTLMEEGAYDKALASFEEAIVIDSGNGTAYYYLAKARHMLGQDEEALGILDKAESLLQSAKNWLEAASILRSRIEAALTSYPLPAAPSSQQL